MFARHLALLVVASAAFAADPVPFASRDAFVPTRVDAPFIDAVRVGEAAVDEYALAIYAAGEVQGLTVADIGCGRGRHVAGFSVRIGPEGRLLATEVQAEQVDRVQQLVDEQGLGNVTVALGSKTDVGLPDASVDVAVLSDVYQAVFLLDGRAGQDKHAFLTSLRRVVKPGGEVVISYVTTSQLRQEDTAAALLAGTLRDFVAYGFEPGRRWSIEGRHWKHACFEFRRPARDADLPASGSYLGRSIATTMHWKGAGWLLRADRERQENATRMLEALGVQPGWTVADVGCGNGYHALRLARLVGAEGSVLAEDIQPEMLDMLRERAAGADADNIQPVLGTAVDANLPPASCDLVLLADVYHEMSHPQAMLAAVRRSLKPGGRVALLEFRAEDPDVPIKPLHKMSRGQILKEMSASGFEPDGSFDSLPWQHLMFFVVEAEVEGG